jgi:hypothetical protein
MKHLIEPKTTISEDGKTVTIVAKLEDAPFNENIITRVTHPHSDPVANHVRHIQSSNAAVFVRHRGHSVVFPNDSLISIAAAIEPATSFPPHFHQGEKLIVHSELPTTYQWQVSDNAFPEADKPHTPPPPAVWRDIPSQTAASLSDNAPVNPGQWVRLMVTNASGKAISKPVKLKAK